MRSYLTYVLVGFFSGGILFSYHIPKILRHVDVTKVSEDNNPGTANAMKHSGVFVGSICLLCDIGKGFLPVAIALRALGCENLLFSAVIAAPVLGHAWAPLYKIKGGKAVAVSFGVFAALIPVSYLVVILAGMYIFFSVIWVIRPNERRSAVVFTFLVFLSVAEAAFYKRWAISVGCSVISAVVVYKNLRDPRLVAHRKKPHEDETVTVKGPPEEK